MQLGEPAAGQLLVATEPGKGGYFDRSVVLILDHGDSGTIGVCLNKDQSMEVVPELAQFRELLPPPGRLIEGGPVSQQTAVGVTQVRVAGEEPLGWRRLFDDVGVLDLDTPIELVRDTYAQLRIFVGLAGWASGQLVGELLRGSWFRTNALAEEVFGTPTDLWRRVLRRMGGEPGMWSTWTEQPGQN
ncbi:MAG: YqgE/AlgH family protein [Propionibacteriaceae bacterium]|nr:YqgE/AlgH family protein [Propionibacteriaceae bacterium]